MGAEEALEYGILDEVSRPDAPVRRLPGSGPAAHGIPAAALTVAGRKTGPVLRAYDAAMTTHRAPPPTAPSGRMGRRPHAGPGELAGRAPTSRCTSSPRWAGPTPSCSGAGWASAGRSCSGTPPRPSARAGDPAHRGPLRWPLRVGPAHRAGRGAGRDPGRDGGGERRRGRGRRRRVVPAGTGRPARRSTRRPTRVPCPTPHGTTLAEGLRGERAHRAAHADRPLHDADDRARLAAHRSWSPAPRRWRRACPGGPAA